MPGSLPTMATDGSRIVYNSAFVGELCRRSLREYWPTRSYTARWDTTAAAANAIRDSGTKPPTWQSTPF